VTIIETLPASSDVPGPRRAVVAIGSGFTGLTATKALKLAQLNITDALVCVARFAAQGTSRFVSQASQWTSVIPAALTLSVLVALSVAAVVDIVKLIGAQSNSGWSTHNDRQADSAYAATAKGWF